VLTGVAGSLLILLAVAIAPVVRLGRRVFLRHRPRPEPQPDTRWLPLTIQVASAVWLALFSVLGIALVVIGGNDAMPPTSYWDKYLVLTNLVTAFAVGFSLFVVFSAIRIWGRTGLRRITQVKYSVVAAACFFLSWFAIHWRLLGPVRL
jgi:hypothetical protein